MNFFIEPFQFAVMRDALLAGSVVSVTCAVLSCFLILKGWSLMGDAISHAVLPGIVIAYIIGAPLILGAFIAGLICAFATGYIKQNSRIREDTVMGVVFTGMFALGLVIFSRNPSELHLDKILVGSLLGISKSQMLQTLILGSGILLTTLALRKDLLLVCFDPAQARVLALPAGFLNYLLLILLALAIVASIQTVGIVLVIAMLITPGCIGHLWTDRFDRMLIIATGAALVATILGILASYHLDASTGACIVLAQSLFFVLSLFFAPKHGILANYRRREENPQPDKASLTQIPGDSK